MLVHRLFFRGLLLSAACLLAGYSLQAQTADDMIKQADDLVRHLKEEEALPQYQAVLVIQPDNLHALIWCSDLSGRMGSRQTQKAKQADLLTAARDYAEKALKVDSTSSDADVVMAIALGKLASSESAKKRVEYGRDIKMYCDKAIHANRANYRAYYILAQWNYQVAHFSGVEKATAKILYGGEPDGSIKNAILNYEKCRSLNPNFIQNYLDLAKAYKEDDQTEKSLSALQTLVKLPVQSEDDPGIKAQGKKMLDDMM